MQKEGAVTCGQNSENYFAIIFPWPTTVILFQLMKIQIKLYNFPARHSFCLFFFFCKEICWNV